MASKTYPSSGGYFNKKMLTILESNTKNESKKTTSKKSAENTGNKKK